MHDYYNPDQRQLDETEWSFLYFILTIIQIIVGTAMIDILAGILVGIGIVIILVMGVNIIP